MGSCCMYCYYFCFEGVSFKLEMRSIRLALAFEGFSEPVDYVITTPLIMHLGRYRFKNQLVFSSYFLSFYRRMWID